MKGHVIRVAALAFTAAVGCADDEGNGADGAAPEPDGGGAEVAMAGDGPRGDGGLDVQADRPEDAARPDAGPPVVWPSEPLAGGWSATTVHTPRPPAVDAGDGGAPDADDAGGPPQAFFSNGTYALEAPGAGLGMGYEDAFLLVYRTMPDDAEITARVVASRGCLAPAAKFGVIVRQSGAPNAPYMFAGATAGGTATLQFRGVQGEYGRTLREERNVALPLWVRISRRGDLFLAGFSTDKVSWITQQRTLTMPDEALFGMAAAAHDAQRPCGAAFTDVEVRPLRATEADGGGG